MSEPAADSPPIQLIANLVVRRADGRVLLVRYGDDERWWLPGGDLRPYEHPGETCARVLADLGLAGSGTPSLHHVESFRGRRGWHVMFNHELACEAAAPQDAAWFEAGALPATAHGAWERGVIEKVLGGG